MRIVILDDKDRPTELEELTEIGRGIIKQACKDMISEIEDIDSKEID